MKKTARQLDAEIRALVATPRPSTDSALWTIRPVFGVAGGPDEIALTSEGNARAFAVGAQVRRGKPAEALEALASVGGSGYLSIRTGNKHARAELGRFDQTVWGYLSERGLVQPFYDERGDGIKLTSAGHRAVRDGLEERTRLLERCRGA